MHIVELVPFSQHDSLDSRSECKDGAEFNRHISLIGETVYTVVVQWLAEGKTQSLKDYNIFLRNKPWLADERPDLPLAVWILRSCESTAGELNSPRVEQKA